MDAEIKTEFDRIGQLLAELAESHARAAKPILTTAEAVALANIGSESAFYRWAKTWGVCSSGGNRWPRQRIQKGLEKEAVSQSRQRAHADRKAAA